MRPKEGTYLAYRYRNPLLGLLPRVHAHFGFRREHRGLHRNGIRMRRDIVRQDQYGRLAIAYEIARHGEDEIGFGAVHVRQIFFNHLHRDVGPALDQFRTPAGHAAVVEQGGHLRPETDRLRQHGRDNTIGRPLQEIPDEWAADAEAHHHELVDAQVIQHTELVISVCIPWPVDFERTRGLAGIGVAQVRRNATVLSFELLDHVKGIFQAGDR